MKIDNTDMAIIAEFQKDGRQSNREVARQLNVSETMVRQRLNKLLKADAVRFDVVTDPRKTTDVFVVLVRISVAPANLEQLLVFFDALPDTGYLSVMTGAFNVQAILVSPSNGDSIESINTQVKALPGVNSIEYRQVRRTVSQDVFEVVCPRPRN